MAWRRIGNMTSLSKMIPELHWQKRLSCVNRCGKETGPAMPLTLHVRALWRRVVASGPRAMRRTTVVAVGMERVLAPGHPQYQHRHHTHDDVLTWRRFPRYWPSIHRWPAYFRHDALKISLLLAWTRCLTNTRVAGVFRHHTHVMSLYWQYGPRNIQAVFAVLCFVWFYQSHRCIYVTNLPVHFMAVRW